LKGYVVKSKLKDAAITFQEDGVLFTGFELPEKTKTEGNSPEKKENKSLLSGYKAIGIQHLQTTGKFFRDQYATKLNKDGPSVSHGVL
jgi:hypothetical protein